MNKLLEALNALDAEADNLCALAKRLEIQAYQHAGKGVSFRDSGTGLFYHLSDIIATVEDLLDIVEGKVP